MLHTITETGGFTWHCHHPERHKDPARTKTLTAHIAHDAVQYVDHDLVALPPCPHCAELGIHCQTFVKVKFTDEELKADNMKQYGMVPTEMTVPHAITGEPVPVMIPALKPIGDNPAIPRHQKFQELLEQHGKRYEPKSLLEQAAPQSDPMTPRDIAQTKAMFAAHGIPVIEVGAENDADQ